MLDPFDSIASLFAPTNNSTNQSDSLSSLLSPPPGLPPVSRPNFLFQGPQSFFEASSDAAASADWSRGSATHDAILNDDFLSLLAATPQQQSQLAAQLQMAALAASTRYNGTLGAAQLAQTRRSSVASSFPSSALLHSPIGHQQGTPIGKGRSGSTSSSSHTSLSSPAPNAYAHPPKNPKLYKTELCRSWMDHGRCNYGERCQYAHGEHEKRPIPRHPKYKTEACQSFHQTGYCPYGPRCHFIHSEAEMTAAQQQRQAIHLASSPITPAKQHVLAASPPQQLSSLLAQSPASLGLLTAVTPQLPSTPSRPTAAYCGSTGDSPGSSSTDSGSESPIGSFSPGLDIDDTPLGLLTGAGLAAYAARPSALGLLGGPVPSSSAASIAARRATTGTIDKGTIKIDGLMNDIVKWTIDEDPLLRRPSSLSTAAPLSSSPPSAATLAATSAVTGPARLPVFAQLSNASSQ